MRSTELLKVNKLSNKNIIPNLKNESKSLSYLVQEKLESIFGPIGYLHISVKLNKIDFTINSNQVKFVNLQELSNFLGTEHINFSGMTEGYKISAYSYSFDEYAEIECFKIDFSRFNNVQKI